ncbi:MAG: hypothetical protein INF69_08780 [Roseomonas sp.]|jgi:hypothetical protein|nr:hypothetical protein [Roseomonas sp.]
MMPKSIEVFRDLNLRGPLARRPDLRHALIAAAQDPWHFDSDRTAKIGRNASSDDVLAFGRKATDGLLAAGLTLCSQDGGYYVPNIVPIEAGELGVAQYNEILADFIKRVVSPVAHRFDYQIDTTEAHQNLENWTSPQAAQKLLAFSATANKSTEASHPRDQQRWFDFVIAVHKSGKAMDPHHLVCWLHEIDGWDKESAHRLASQYETALSLLKHYDRR